MVNKGGPPDFSGATKPERPTFPQAPQPSWYGVGTFGRDSPAAEAHARAEYKEALDKYNAEKAEALQRYQEQLEVYNKQKKAHEEYLAREKLAKEQGFSSYQELQNEWAKQQREERKKKEVVEIKDIPQQKTKYFDFQKDEEFKLKKETPTIQPVSDPRYRREVIEDTSSSLDMAPSAGKVVKDFMEPLPQFQKIKKKEVPKETFISAAPKGTRKIGPFIDRQYGKLVLLTGKDVPTYTPQEAVTLPFEGVRRGFNIAGEAVESQVDTVPEKGEVEVPQKVTVGGDKVPKMEYGGGMPLTKFAAEAASFYALDRAVVGGFRAATRGTTAAAKAAKSAKQIKTLESERLVILAEQTPIKQGEGVRLVGIKQTDEALQVVRARQLVKQQDDLSQSIVRGDVTILTKEQGFVRQEFSGVAKAPATSPVVTLFGRRADTGVGGESQVLVKVGKETTGQKTTYGKSGELFTELEITQMNRDVTKYSDVLSGGEKKGRKTVLFGGKQIKEFDAPTTKAEYEAIILQARSQDAGSTFTYGGRSYRVLKEEEVSKGTFGIMSEAAKQTTKQSGKAIKETSKIDVTGVSLAGSVSPVKVEQSVGIGRAEKEVQERKVSSVVSPMIESRSSEELKTRSGVLTNLFYGTGIKPASGTKDKQEERMKTLVTQQPKIDTKQTTKPDTDITFVPPTGLTPRPVQPPLKYTPPPPPPTLIWPDFDKERVRRARPVRKPKKSKVINEYTPTLVGISSGFARTKPPKKGSVYTGFEVRLPRKKKKKMRDLIWGI